MESEPRWLKSAEQFEREYAARSGITVERLREVRAVKPCRCGEEGCEGWQMLTHRMVADMLADAAHPEATDYERMLVAGWDQSYAEANDGAVTAHRVGRLVVERADIEVGRHEPPNEGAGADHRKMEP